MTNEISRLIGVPRIRYMKVLRNTCQKSGSAKSRL